MIANSCWVWDGSKTQGGYGRASVGGQSKGTHHHVYEAYFGLIPQGLELDHTCRNRACYNPHHLEAVTHQENKRREVTARTHCAHGHKFTAENTYIRKIGRACRTCKRISDRARYAKLVSERKDAA